MATLQTFAEKVRQRAGGADALPDMPSFAEVLTQVIPELSVSAARAGRARLVELTITGDGTDEYGLGSDWTTEFSTVVSVYRWDSNDTDERPIRLEDDEWEVEERLPSAGSPQIRFLTFSPSSSDRVVVTHTALHVIDATSSSVKTYDEEALADLAAARYLRIAATRLLSRVPNNTDGDILGGSTQAEHARELRSSASVYEQAYRDHFGLGTSDEPKSGVSATVVDIETPTGILNYIHTHPRRYRGF